MLKFETSSFHYIVNMNTVSPVISYNDGEVLYLDKTETEGFYFIGVYSISPDISIPIPVYMPLRRVHLNCLLVEDKIYTMKGEPCYYV